MKRCPCLQCPLPDELLNILKGLKFTKAYLPYAWIATAVTETPEPNALADAEGRKESVGQVCVIRQPTRNYEELFESRQLPKSIIDLEVELKSKSKVAFISGLFIPTPSFIGETTLPCGSEPNVIEQILPLSNVSSPPPSFVNFRFDPEHWTKEMTELYENSKR